MTFGTTYLEILAVPEYSDSEFTCISGRFYDKGTNICIEVLWQELSPIHAGVDFGRVKKRKSIVGKIIEHVIQSQDKGGNNVRD